VPDSTSQAKAETIVKRLYSAEYRNAKLDAEAAQKLAATLLRESKATKDDPVLRFAGLGQARDLAATAGDAFTALQAIEELVRHYEVKGLGMKSAALTTAARTAANKEANQAIVDAALHIVDEALLEDDYDAAKRLIEAAETAGARLKNLALYGRIDKRSHEIEDARKEFARMKPFADRLAKNPADAEANFQLGKYACLIKGNWERGVPLLAKGNNAVWKAFAEKELTRPKEPRKQVDLGDECTQLAETQQGQAKRNLQRRALHWYQRALPKLEGLTRVRIERETRELAKLFPTPELDRVEIVAEVYRINTPAFAGLAAAALSPDGKQALSGGFQDKAVRLWDVQTGKELRQLTGHLGGLQCVAFSSDGKFAASGCSNLELRLWDLQSGMVVRQFFGHNDFLRGVCFFPDGKRLLSAADDSTLRIWDVNSGLELKRLMGHLGYINSLAMNKDGTRAITAGQDGTARLWDLVKGMEIQTFKHAPVPAKSSAQSVWGAALSPDGKLAVTASVDRTVRIWEVASGKELRRLPHTSLIYAVAFAPDGRTILTGGGNPPDFGKFDPLMKKDGGPPASVPGDYAMRVWDVETGKELRRLEGHTGQIRTLGFSSDGRLAFSAGHDGGIRIWGQRK